jgi:hypothetical protein
MKEHKSLGSSLAVKVPPGMSIWNPKPGSYRVDIIPFKAGKDNPFADKGELYFERTYVTHQKCVGPNRATVICPAGTWPKDGKPCFVCTRKAEMGKEPDLGKDDIENLRRLKQKERQLWLVYVHEEKGKGVQLFEISNAMFGENLEKKIGARKELRQKRMRFADPEHGLTLVLTVEEKEIGANKAIEITVDEFIERKKPLPEEILEQAVCLDDLIEEPSYKMVKKMFDAAPPDEDDEDDDEHKKKRRPADEEDDDDDEQEGEEEDEEEDEEDEDQDDDEGDEDDDSDDDDDEEEDDDEDDPDLGGGDEPPASLGQLITCEYKGKTIKGRVRKVNKADNLFGVESKKYPGKMLWIGWDDLVTDEDSEDDEPAPRKKPKKKKRPF